MLHLLQDDHAAQLSPRGYLAPLPSHADASSVEVDQLINGERPRYWVASSPQKHR